MLYLLMGPTQLIWGNSAMTGGLLYLAYLVITKGFVILMKNKYILILII